MGLIDQIEAPLHAPTLEVYVGGARAIPLAVTTAFGLDVVAATATITISRYPAFGGLRVPVEIRAGYGGHTIPVFNGHTESTERGFAPHTYLLHCSGWLRLAQYQYHEEVVWENQTDEQVVEALLGLAGIRTLSVDGSGRTFDRVVLREGSSPWDVINHLDQLTGYKTFDGPDGTVRRRRISGIPASSAAWELREGENLLAAARPRSFAPLHNQVVVYGRPDNEGNQPAAIRQADSDWVPNPPRWVTFDFRSDLIADDAHADEVAARLMTELNHVAERVNGDAPGNPYFAPGMTIAVAAAHLGLEGGPYHYLLENLTQTWDTSGFTTTTRLFGGIGSPGEPGDLGDDGDGEYEDGVLPEPSIEWSMTREAFLPEAGEVADVGTDELEVPVLDGEGEVVGWETQVTGPQRVRYYTFNGNASGSYSPIEPPDLLTYAWSNNKNGDTSSDLFYATAFTQAEMEDDADCTVSLAITDSQSNTRTVTIPLEATDAETRFLALVMDGLGYVSPDGGEHWKMVTFPERDAPLDEHQWMPVGSLLDNVAGGDGTWPNGTQLYITGPTATVDPNGDDYGFGLAYPNDDLTFFPDYSSGYYRVSLAPDTVTPTITPHGNTLPFRDISDDKGENKLKITLFYDNGGTLYSREVSLSDEGEHVYLNGWGDGAHVVDDTATLPEAEIQEIYGFRARVDRYQQWAGHVETGQYVTQYGLLIEKLLPPQPPTGVVSTLEIAALGWTLFGLEDGRVFRVGAVLIEPAGQAPSVQAPSELIFDWQDFYPDTPVGTEPPVTAIWLSEATHRRITVECGGRLFRTTDDAETWDEVGGVPEGGPTKESGSATLPTYLIESALTPGEYRYAGNDFVWLRFAGPGNWFPAALLDPPPADSPGYARKAILSPFGNYAIWRVDALAEEDGGASGDGRGLALGESDGVARAVPALPYVGVPPGAGVGQPPAHDSGRLSAATTHIRDDVLYALTETGYFLEKPSEESAFLLRGLVPGAATHWFPVDGDPGADTGRWYGPRHINNDNSMPLVLYVAASLGVVKTWDGGTTWRWVFGTPAEDISYSYDPAEVDPRARLGQMIGRGSPEWFV